VELFGQSGGKMLYNQSRGIGSDVLGTYEGRKSISKERTFSQDIRDKDFVRETLLGLAAGIGRIARSQSLAGRVVTIKIRMKGFETHTRRKTLPCGTNSDKMIFNTAWDLFLSSGFSHRRLRLVGVGISDWSEKPGTQIQMFDKPDEKETRLYNALDQLTEKFGKGTIAVGSVGKKNSDKK
jgi:DNA polymerase-4